MPGTGALDGAAEASAERSPCSPATGERRNARTWGWRPVGRWSLPSPAARSRRLRTDRRQPAQDPRGDRSHHQQDPTGRPVRLIHRQDGGQYAYGADDGEHYRPKAPAIHGKRWPPFSEEECLRDYGPSDYPTRRRAPPHPIVRRMIDRSTYYREFPGRAADAVTTGVVPRPAGSQSPRGRRRRGHRADRAAVGLADRPDDRQPEPEPRAPVRSRPPRRNGSNSPGTSA